ncbi:MAG: hypothetical protein FWC43_01410 [Planctomycetaceae bacterium]|nr:hypothetical protein [Planctomycetaceae bacterium]
MSSGASSKKSPNPATGCGCLLFLIIIIGGVIGWWNHWFDGVPRMKEPAPFVPPSPAPPPPPPPVDEREVYYEQLLRKRLEFQEKIFEAMELYGTTSQEVHGQRTRLRELLGDKPVSEAIELFSKGKVPPDMRIAYSCWRTLIPDETQRLQIAMWIDKQQLSGILEQLDIQIKEFENRRRLGKILNQEELAEIDLLLAQQVVGWETVEISDKALLEEEAINLTV